MHYKLIFLSAQIILKNKKGIRSRVISLIKDIKSETLKC